MHAHIREGEGPQALFTTGRARRRGSRIAIARGSRAERLELAVHDRRIDLWQLQQAPALRTALRCALPALRTWD